MTEQFSVEVKVIKDFLRSSTDKYPYWLRIYMVGPIRMSFLPYKKGLEIIFCKNSVVLYI